MRIKFYFSILVLFLLGLGGVLLYLAKGMKPLHLYIVEGIIAFILVFLLGHTMNIAINLLGAYVHTNRLQYVEFFGKFYVDGGEPFDPFRRKTKYIRFENEE